MNDYAMRYLAAERSRDLRAQADRHRLANAARMPRQDRRHLSPSARRLSLGWLLRRVTA
jgi:hypothetical protein